MPARPGDRGREPEGDGGAPECGPCPALLGLEPAVEQYRLDNMDYPPTLQALVSMPNDLARPERYRRGGYIRRLPNDPWGNAYIYVSPGANGSFDLSSYGKDGVPGGEGINKDINNWDME